MRGEAGPELKTLLREAECWREGGRFTPEQYQAAETRTTKHIAAQLREKLAKNKARAVAAQSTAGGALGAGKAAVAFAAMEAATAEEGAAGLKGQLAAAVEQLEAAAKKAAEQAIKIENQKKTLGNYQAAATEAKALEKATPKAGKGGATPGFRAPPPSPPPGAPPAAGGKGTKTFLPRAG
jgi:hypothetical protein